MANRTLNWVGTTSAYATASNWIDQATGVAPATGPDAGDNVRFGTGTGATNNACTVTVTAAAARSVDCTGYTGTLTIPAATTWNIGDATAGTGNIAVKFVAGMTLTIGNIATSVITLVSTSATQQTIDCGAKTIGAMTINGTGSSYVLSSATTGGGVFTLTAGTFATANYAMNFSSFYWGATATTRTLSLGSSYLTATTASTAFWTLGANMTITANTATIEMPNSSPNSVTFIPLSYNWNGLSVVFGPAGGNFGGTGTGTVANITYNGGAIKTGVLTFRPAITITGTLTVNGNSAENRVLICADQLASQTITAANVSFSNVDFGGITAAGAANWDLSAITGGSGDCYTNTGITFTPSAPQAANGTTSFNWSDASRWTSRVPLPQDDVTIANAFSASQTIGMDMPRIGRDITITATGTGLSLVLSSITGFAPYVIHIRFFGSFSSTVPFTNVNRTIIASGNYGTYTFASNGIQTPQIIVNGSYTFTDDVTSLSSTTNDFTVSSGTANTKNITTIGISQNGGTWNPGAYTLSCWRTSGNTCYFTGGTFNGSAATIVWATASVGARTFFIGVTTWALGTFTYNVASSAGTALFSHNVNVAIGTVNIGPGRSLTLPSTYRLDADTWNISGVPNDHVYMPGDGPGASVPDSAALSIAGDMDFRQRMSFDSYAPGVAMRIAAKYLATGNQRTWRWYMASGFMTLDMSTTGADSSGATASVSLATAGLSLNTTYWMRFTREKTTGNVKFYYAPDSPTMPASWTQIGTTLVATTSNLFDSTAKLSIGGDELGGGTNLAGRVYQSQMRNNILDNGTGIQLDAVFSAKAMMADTFTEGSANAATVTMASLSLLGDGRVAIASSHGTNVAYVGRRYGGRIELSYASLTRIACAQPYGLYATNSTNVAGNINCTFSAAPTTGLYRLQSAFSSLAGTSITVTLPRTATAGNMLVAVALAITGGGTVTGPAGWTVGPVSQIGASTCVRYWTKLSDGTETAASLSSTNSSTHSLMVYELAGFQGTPTVDVSDGANNGGSSTSLSTAGTAPSNTGTPAFAIAGVSMNSSVTAVSASNSFGIDFTTNAAAACFVAAKPLTTIAPVSTTFSWTTARQAAAGVLVIKDVASASFLMFM